MHLRLLSLAHLAHQQLGFSGFVRSRHRWRIPERQTARSALPFGGKPVALGPAHSGGFHLYTDQKRRFH